MENQTTQPEWAKSKLKRKLTWWQIALIVIAAVYLIDLVSDTSKPDKTVAENISDKRYTANESSDGATTKAVQPNETLHTQYFDVTLGKVDVTDFVNTGNEFSNVKAGKEERFLIINATFKNTDSESRMITDGEVLVNFEGKDYKFDHPETIMADGYGVLLDQINPLTSKTTKLVYKIPASLRGTLYWRPGRADSDELILLGNLNE